MSKELEALKEVRNHRHEKDKNLVVIDIDYLNKCIDGIENILKDYENIKEENRLLRENIENLDETYFDTWYACERLKKNSNYALIFVDNTYCLVDTKDANETAVIDEYKVNNKGIIDNEAQKKLKALKIIEEIDKNALLQFISVCVKDQDKYDLLKEVLL